jgi:chromosome segregation ATPase
LKEAQKQLAEWDKELNQLHERNGDLGLEVQNLKEQLEKECASREEIEAELSDLKQKSATAGEDFPDVADLLNQLKARRKKSRADLGDIEMILELLS